MATGTQVPWTDPGGTPCCCFDCYNNNDIIIGAPEAPHSLLQWFDTTPATWALLLAGGTWTARWNETVTCFERQTLQLFPSTETGTIERNWTVTTTSPAEQEFPLNQIYPAESSGTVCHWIGKATNIPLQKNYSDSGITRDSDGVLVQPPASQTSTGTTEVTFVVSLNNEQRVNFTAVQDPLDPTETGPNGRAIFVAPLAIQRTLSGQNPIFRRVIGYRLGNFANNYPDTLTEFDANIVGPHEFEFAEPNVTFSATVQVGAQTFFPTAAVNVRLSAVAFGGVDFILFASWPRYYVNQTNYFGGGATLAVTFVPSAP